MRLQHATKHGIGLWFDHACFWISVPELGSQRFAKTTKQTKKQKRNKPRSHPTHNKITKLMHASFLKVTHFAGVAMQCNFGNDEIFLCQLTVCTAHRGLTKKNFVICQIVIVFCNCGEFLFFRLINQY